MCVCVDINRWAPERRVCVCVCVCVLVFSPGGDTKINQSESYLVNSKLAVT